MDGNVSSKMRIVNPVGHRRPVEEIHLAKRHSSLEGKAIGFIDNFKPNVGPFLTALEDLFREDYPNVKTYRVRKEAQASYIIADRLVGKADAVVNAWGD